MTARLLILVRHDVRLQCRYGIYLAYAFVVGFYVACLIWLGEALPPWLPALIIFTDPSVLGFFFLGALMMLEKSEATRHALAITPVSAGSYFWAKTLTLTAMSLVSVTLIAPFIHAGAHYPLLAASTVLIAISFIGIAVPAALWFKTVTSYLMGAAGWLTPVVAPGFLALLDPFPLWLTLIPTAAQFRLVLVATGAVEASGPELAACLLVTTMAAIAGVMVGLRALAREFGRP